jgi:acyl carrier protein
MSEQDDVIDLLQRAAVAVTGRALAGLDPSTNLAATGIDSVALLEIVGWMEDHLGLRLPDDEIARIATVADLVALVARTRRAAEGG